MSGEPEGAHFSSRRDIADERLKRSLRRHGIRGAAATSVVRVRSELIALTRETGREFAAAVNLDSGRAEREVLAGEIDEGNLGTQIAAMSPTRRYIQIHTHPESSSFSDADVDVLLGHSVIAAMIAVGADGTSYVLTKTNPQWQHHSLTAVIEWNRVHEALFPRYRRAVRSGRLSQAEARRRHTHAVMGVISREFDLRYSRVRGAV